MTKLTPAKPTSLLAELDDDVLASQAKPDPQSNRPPRARPGGLFKGNSGQGRAVLFSYGNTAPFHGRPGIAPAQITERDGELTTQQEPHEQP